MSAISTTNTKELREKAAAIYKQATERMASAPKNENGGYKNADDREAILQMCQDSKDLISQADTLENGKLDPVKMAADGKFDVSEKDLKDIRHDRWQKPIKVAMGRGTIDLNPNRPIESLLSSGLPSEVLEDSKSIDLSSFSEKYHKKVMEFQTRPGKQAMENSGMQATTVGGQQIYCNPIRFSAMILDFCRERLWIRQLASGISVLDSCSTGIIREVDTPSSAAWGDACKEPKECETPKFELKTLSPEWMAYCADVCRLLLNQRCSFDVEPFIARKLAWDAAKLEEEAFFWGDGKKKPLGIFYDPSDSADYCGGLAANDYETDCMFTCGMDWTTFLKAEMQLPECTRNDSMGSKAWMFSKEIICEIMSMCDGNGRPLLLQDIRGGGRPMLRGYPIYESAHAPSTMQAGDFWGVLADFSGYYIADGLMQSLERDDNIKKNRACWVGRKSVDGMVVDPEKFVRLKCKAA